jgi:hypothetical protein
MMLMGVGLLLLRDKQKLNTPIPLRKSKQATFESRTDNGIVVHAQITRAQTRGPHVAKHPDIQIMQADAYALSIELIRQLRKVDVPEENRAKIQSPKLVSQDPHQETARKERRMPDTK